MNLLRRVEQSEAATKSDRVIKLEVRWARNEAEAKAAETAGHSMRRSAEPGVKYDLCWVD